MLIHTVTMFLSAPFKRIALWVGGASAPPSRDKREAMMRRELVEYYKTGVEPEVDPYNGEAEGGDKILRCEQCDTLVFKTDKKKLHDEHLGHMLKVAIGGTVEEALMLKYRLIRSDSE